MKENTETNGVQVTEILERFPWLLIPVGVILIWIGFGYLWNHKIHEMRVSRGVATASFNNILGRVLRFVFKEDKYPIYVKDEKGENTKVLKYPKYGKYLVWRNVYFLGFGLSLALSVIGNEASAWILGATLMLIGTRTSKVFAARHAMLVRMFEVAASELGFPREANTNPWRWVQIREWDNLVIPGETYVAFPNKYKSEEQKNRENFERHFNGTITDDNTWLYHWKSSKSMVVCSPVTHIPEFAAYPGSSKGEWNKIPLGVGTEGEVFWDVSSSPMSLITGTTGGGKLCDLRHIIETTKGQKSIGTLKVGDKVFDPEGNITKVEHLHPIVTPAKAYELTFSNGEKIIADPGHLWETETREARLSRFGSVKKEVKRSRSYWLDKAVRANVVAAYEASTNLDTISIKEVGELTEKSATTVIFRDIAKEVGVAEEVRPQITLYHKAAIMKQQQTMTYANSEQIMAVYNARNNAPTKAKPVTRNQFDKLRQMLTEVRDTDALTADSMVEYLGGNKFTESWVRENFNSTLGTQESIQDLYTKADLVKSLFPDKIFSIDAEYVNARQLASLFGMECDKYFRGFFQKLCVKVEDTVKRKEEVELVRPERTTVQEGAPYFTYPKKMFLERILRHDETPLNDQRHKRIMPEIRTTQEIFDTLKTTGATIYTNHSIRKAKALQMSEVELPVMPYSMGAWLGDGDSRRGSVCGIDHQVFDNIIADGYAPTEISLSAKKRNGNDDFRRVHFPDLSRALKEENLFIPPFYSVRRDGSTKHIPSVYFSSSIEQRRELLRGLLDTDGSVKDNGAVQFYTSVPQLRDDAKRLIAGLGYIPFVSEKQPTYDYKGENLRSETTAYTLTFQADPADRLFGLDRKNKVHAERFNSNNVHSTVDVHYIVDIKEVEPVPMRCISVDSPTRLFLVGESMIPTHNSTIQRNIIFHCIQHPDRWRFLGIDVKRVELSPYISYDPVVMGIATDVPDGVEIIRYAKEEMEKRYKEMEANGVNHFKDLPTQMHALMVMIDESYMFLAPSGIKTDEGKEEDALKGEASKLIGDIARLGRAAGVHLVLATQRPDATVIYGELKQNLACRIAAGKADSIASMMTLDNDNATRLPGDIKGRGYVQTFGVGEQFQGYFAPQKWIDKYLANDTEWLAHWAKEAQDLDSVSKEEVPEGKKTKKAKAPKNSKKMLESDEVFDEAPKKKKTGGLLGRINEVNAKHAPILEDTEKQGVDFSKNKNADNFESTTEPETTLLEPASANSNAELNKLVNEMNTAVVEERPKPFESPHDDEDPFAGLNTGLDDPFADLMGEDSSSDIFSGQGSSQFEFDFEVSEPDESLFKVSEPADNLFNADDSFSFPVDEDVTVTTPPIPDEDDPFANLLDDGKPVAKKPLAKTVSKALPKAAESDSKPVPAPRQTSVPPAAPVAAEKAPSAASAGLPPRPRGLPPRPTRKA